MASDSSAAALDVLRPCGCLGRLGDAIDSSLVGVLLSTCTVFVYRHVGFRLTSRVFVCSPLLWLDWWAFCRFCLGHIRVEQTSLNPCRPSFSKREDPLWLLPFSRKTFISGCCLRLARSLAQPINQCSCTTATLTRPSGGDALLPADGEVQQDASGRTPASHPEGETPAGLALKSKATPFAPPTQPHTLCARRVRSPS